MNDPFINVDRDLLAAQLRLRERGEEQGGQDQPPPDAGALDNVEMEAISKIAEHYARAQIETTNSLRTYDRSLSELALLSRLSSIRTEARRAISDYKAEVTHRLNRLSAAREQVANTHRHVVEFKAEHHLTRPAHAVPPSIATTGAIALAWLAETTINAFLLKQNDQMGYLGGVVAAATVGAINIFVAAFVGRLVWPRTNVHASTVRLLAWAGIGGWLVFVGVWNLLAAHFRDAKSLGLEQPERQALFMMGQGLESMYSWGLLIAGVVFAITAAIASYRRDDPYPGYGELSRRYDLACEDYSDEVKEAMDELLGIRDDALEGAISVRQELERQLAEYNQILTARASYVRRFDQYGSQLELLANALLQEYRAANRSARTLAEPAHFKATWKLDRTVPPPASATSINAQDVAAAESALDQAVSEISGAFDAAIERFEPLEDLKRRLANV